MSVAEVLNLKEEVSKKQIEAYDKKVKELNKGKFSFNTQGYEDLDKSINKLCWELIKQDGKVEELLITINNPDKFLLTDTFSFSLDDYLYRLQKVLSNRYYLTNIVTIKEFVLSKIKSPEMPIFRAITEYDLGNRWCYEVKNNKIDLQFMYNNLELSSIPTLIVDSVYLMNYLVRNTHYKPGEITMKLTDTSFNMDKIVDLENYLVNKEPIKRYEVSYDRLENIVSFVNRMEKYKIDYTSDTKMVGNIQESKWKQIYAEYLLMMKVKTLELGY